VIALASIRSAFSYVLNVLIIFNLLSYSSCIGRIDSNASSLFACFYALFSSFFFHSSSSSCAVVVGAFGMLLTDSCTHFP